MKIFPKTVFRFSLYCNALMFFTAIPLAHGLVIRDYDASTHNRFSSGYPSNPVNNAGFIAAGQDLSGLGWDAGNPNRSFALVSPQHFVGANHFKPSIGSTINFFSTDGQLRSYTLSSIHNVKNGSNENTDLFVGELSAPIAVSDNVSFFPVPDLATEAQYLGRQLTVYGKTAVAGSNVIAGFQDFGGDPITGGSGINSTRTYFFNYNSISGGSNDARGEVGDSGSPSFIMLNGKLAVVGTHTAILNVGSTTITYDSFVPNYVAEINLQIQSSGFQLTMVPEPSSWALALSGSVMVLLMLSRYNRRK